MGLKQWKHKCLKNIKKKIQKYIFLKMCFSVKPQKPRMGRHNKDPGHTHTWFLRQHSITRWTPHLTLSFYKHYNTFSDSGLIWHIAFLSFWCCGVMSPYLTLRLSTDLEQTSHNRALTTSFLWKDKSRFTDTISGYSIRELKQEVKARSFIIIRFLTDIIFLGYSEQHVSFNLT